MGLQPTASRTDLLIQCQRPFDPATEIEPEEPSKVAKAAQAEHKVMHAAIFSPKNAQAMPESTLIRLKVLRAWMQDHELVPTSGETPLAFHIGTKVDACVSRKVEFDAETHHYSLHSGMPVSYDMGGTPDLELKGPKFTAVLDYKMGEKWNWEGHDPRTGQNMTIALARGHRMVAILHAPERSIPVVHYKEITQGELEVHRAKLRLALSRIGDGSMRTGPECLFCPARDTCPTQVGNLLIRVEALVRKLLGPVSLVEVEDVGALYSLLGPMEKLLDKTRAVIKEKVEQGAVIETPKGATLEITPPITREFPSIKGLTEDQKRILRSWGGLVKRTWTELRAK